MINSTLNNHLTKISCVMNRYSKKWNDKQLYCYKYVDHIKIKIQVKRLKSSEIHFLSLDHYNLRSKNLARHHQ